LSFGGDVVVFFECPGKPLIDRNNNLDQFRWLADFGLNRRLKVYLWPSFHTLHASGTLGDVLAIFLKRYPTNKNPSQKKSDDTSRCDVSWAG
jgi:hypothetical protein